ncbi:MAG: hypothetical protein WC570_00115 [Patescibacteria group bacterium]
MKKNIKTKNKVMRKDVKESVVEIMRQELKDIDCLLDDYFEEQPNEMGQKWFSFNESRVMGADEVLRISVWGLNDDIVRHNDFFDSYYTWVGDMVAGLDKAGKLQFKRENTRKGEVADEIFELFKGFCGGKVACSFPEVIELKLII